MNRPSLVVALALAAPLAACASDPAAPPDLGAAAVQQNGQSVGVTAAWAERGYAFLDNNDSYGVLLIQFTTSPGAVGQPCSARSSLAPLAQAFDTLDLDTNHEFSPQSIDGSFSVGTGSYTVVRTDSLGTTSVPAMTVATFPGSSPDMSGGTVTITQATSTSITGTFTATGSDVSGTTTLTGSFDAPICPDQKG